MEQQKKSILEEAAELTRGPRAAAYGTPAENHGRTAALWSAYLGVSISARDVCMLNVLQKLSRDRHSPGRDNLVDVAGYAENADRCGALRFLPLKATVPVVCHICGAAAREGSGVGDGPMCLACARNFVSKLEPLDDGDR
jgi:hypothetical protein